MGRQQNVFSKKCFLSLSNFLTNDTEHPDNILIRYLSYTNTIILPSTTVSFLENISCKMFYSILFVYEMYRIINQE